MKNKNNVRLTHFADRTYGSAAQKRTKLAGVLFRVLFCLLLVFTAFSYVFFPENAFRLFGIRPYLISYTGSMEPELNYCDMIFVRKCAISELKEGDIITFRARRIDSDGQIVITHSVEKIFTEKDTGKRFIRTRGIAREDSDAVPVTADGSGGTNTLIGKYVFKSAALGRISGFLQSRHAVFAAVFCICGSCLIIIISQREKRGTN